MSQRDVQTPGAMNCTRPRPVLPRSPLSWASLFAGLTGLTSMLFFVGWTDVRPPGGSGAPYATPLFAALLTVSALFAVARLWPSRAPSPGRGTDRK